MGVGGRPRQLQGRVARQISLDHQSDEIAQGMNNFSAFVRSCLGSRSESNTYSMVALLNMLQRRIADHGTDQVASKATNEFVWTDSEAEMWYDELAGCRAWLQKFEAKITKVD